MNASELYNWIKQNFNKNDELISKLTRLHYDGILDENEYLETLSGPIMSYFNNFELYIEKLFLGLITSEIGMASPIAVKFTLTGADKESDCRDILAGQSNYIAWMPYDGTLALSKKVFAQDSPFVNLTQSDKDNLSKIYMARNAIAHGSKYALKKFFNKYSAPIAYHNHHPTKFLLKIYDSNQQKNSINFIRDHLLMCALKLTSNPNNSLTNLIQA